MERNIISFSANQQELIKTGGISHYASNVVGYIVAEFDLGENWTEFDSVRAVFKSDYETVPAVLSRGACVIPFEVLKRRSTVKMNLVGSVAESNVLVDRLTSYPITALVVDANATVDNDIEPITPTEFEQFVAAVKADADRSEAGAESAAAAAENAEASEQAALASAQAAEASALRASNSASDADASAETAQAAAETAQAGAEAAETAQAGAEAAQTAAETAQAGAEAAETAQAGAEAAQTAAETAQAGAEAAQARATEIVAGCITIDAETSELIIYE